MLEDFYSEREQNEKRFEDLKVQMEQQQPKTPLSMDMFSEDWNASQFWVIILVQASAPLLLTPAVQRRDSYYFG